MEHIIWGAAIMVAIFLGGLTLVLYGFWVTIIYAAIIAVSYGVGVLNTWERERLRHQKRTVREVLREMQYDRRGNGR